MSNLFLDPASPLATCAEKTCAGCPVSGRLCCHFGIRDVLRFLAGALPAVLAGGIGTALVNPWLMMPWIAACAAFFGFAEIRVLCSHCPHYAEPGISSLKCWANYGMPKPWKYRPGPMTAMEKAVFFGWGILIIGYPAAVMIGGGQWIALAIFGLFWTATAFIMGAFMCRRCMNFACPLNAVPPSVRSDFFARNPLIAKAWEPRGRKEAAV